ncbi:NAD-dependent epimerase/dehydratase family protein [Leekyejoonella antrihumi]|uniref:NAD-dependent epimerase/dehydratase family protein n=1 Tax=Leekyejoonella antrihumi TaxID=1660198 RepID=A0A563E8Z2_9MICO|nr:NAD-dependent epimerase/dehydratase family protein [Leekyejoonella antrihumi]TWP39038.1 NAD-dependent epimerase/dehydratase family protein [Leekyejoonella antrihumi]
MKLLILGGTAFLGHAVATEAVSRGHDVTCVARGESGQVPAGAGLVVADRDRDDALANVAEQHWDAAVDVARQPGHVRRAGRDLSRAAEHLVFVSTGNVYADTKTPGLDESAALLDPLADDSYTDMQAYGPGKVACEQAVLEAFGPKRCTIARAGLIGGPGDTSGRSGYWPWRFAHPSTPGGQILIPAASEIPAQVIDVRDLARWLVDCAEQRLDGAFNAAGERTTLTQVLEVARRVAGFAAEVVAAENDWLLSEGVSEWAGPKSLPLWLTDPDWRGFCDRNISAAQAGGLRLRPIEDTMRGALAYEESRAKSHPRAAGLSDADERNLLEAYAANVIRATQQRRDD